MAAEELAKQLECDISLIKIDIQSATGGLNRNGFRVNKEAATSSGDKPSN
jgi:hypothetical protein